MKNNIIINKKARDAKFTKDFNILAFLLNCAIPIMDRLKETDAYNKEIKFHGNQFLKVAEKFTDRHQRLFIFGGNIPIPDSDKTINANDIFNITDTAYEKMLDWMQNRHPNHIVSVMTTIEKLEASGKLNLNDVLSDYVPVDSDLVNA